jgi:hypothetical protein
MNDPQERLIRLLDLVGKEDEHLLAVRKRLVGEDCRVNAQRVQQATIPGSDHEIASKNRKIATNSGWWRP